MLIIQKANLLLRRLGRVPSVKDAAWMFIEKFIVLGGIFISGIMVTRYLGPALTGVINYAHGIQALFVAVMFLGLEGIFIKKYVANASDQDDLADAAWTLLTISGITGFVLLNGLGLIAGYASEVKLAILGVSVPLVMLRTQMYEWIFRAYSNMRHLSKLRIWAIVSVQILKIALVIFGADFKLFILAIAVEPVIIWGVSKRAYAVNGYREPVVSVKLLKKFWSAFLKESWPLLVASLAVVVYSRIDVVMLKAMMGVESVGVYMSAVRMSEIWHVIPATLCSAFYAKWVSSNSESEGQFNRMAKFFLVGFFAASAVISISVQAVAQGIINCVYGAAFVGGGEVLGIHVWSAVPVYVGCFLTSIYVIIGHSKYVLFGTVAGAVLNIALNLKMIPIYGPRGAAMVTVLSNVFALIIPLMCSRGIRSRLFRIMAS